MLFSLQSLVLFLPFLILLSGGAAISKDSLKAKVDRSAKTIQRKNEELPKLLKEVEAKYAEAKTVVAQFKQIKTLKAFPQPQESSGKISLKIPGKVLWETEKPERGVLVSDGKMFWNYTPPFDEEDSGQVIIADAKKLQTRFARALLSGAFSSAKGMTVEKKSETSFDLFPKKGTAGTVKKATVTIHSTKKLIENVEVEHFGGNRLEVKLSDIELGKEVKDEAFQFKIPPGTEVIRN